MATIFEIRIHHNDRVYAEQAAVDAFRLLDRIESDLNRHDPNSDVSQLNAAEPGEEIRLGLHAYQCLQLAFVVHEASRGAFDVTVGGIKDLYAQAGSWWQRLTGRCAAKTHRVGMRHMQMVDDRRAVILDAPVTVDLGGIGKGYAVDRMMERLTEWDLSEVIVHGGASSAAARGQGWPATIRHPLQQDNVLTKFSLENRAMGASGVNKGEHIIHPGRKRPVRGVLAAWVVAEDAATADAFSTAFMVLTAEEAEACLQKRPDLAALVIYKQKDEEVMYRCGI